MAGGGKAGRPGWRNARGEDGERKKWNPESGTTASKELTAWVEHLRDLLSVFATDREVADALKWDKGKISLYVNGRELPSADFVNGLLRAERPEGVPVTDEVRALTRTRHLAALKGVSPTRAEKYRAAYERDELIKKVSRLEERDRLLREEIAASARRAQETTQRLQERHCAEQQRLAKELDHSRDQVRALQQRLADAEQQAEQAHQAAEADGCRSNRGVVDQAVSVSRSR